MANEQARTGVPRSGAFKRNRKRCYKAVFAEKMVGVARIELATPAMSMQERVLDLSFFYQ